MAVLLINAFIVEGGVIFTGTASYGTDIIQKLTIPVKQFKHILVSLADTDMLIGSIDKPGFEVCLFRGLKTHDATVFHKLAERHFYRVFYSR